MRPSYSYFSIVTGIIFAIYTVNGFCDPIKCAVFDHPAPNASFVDCMKAVGKEYKGNRGFVSNDTKVDSLILELHDSTGRKIKGRHVLTNLSGTLKDYVQTEGGVYNEWTLRQKALRFPRSIPTDRLRVVKVTLDEKTKVYLNPALSTTDIQSNLGSQDLRIYNEWVCYYNGLGPSLVRTSASASASKHVFSKMFWGGDRQRFQKIQKKRKQQCSKMNNSTNFCTGEGRVYSW